VQFTDLCQARASS